MFCLVTDLMDWEDYPGPELASLYKWRWDGSETALREAKAPLRGAGPGTGPMLRSGSPDLVRQELAAWAAGTGMTRGVARDAALAAAPARKGRRAGLPVRPRDLSFARAAASVLAAIRLGNTCYQAVTSEIGKYRNVVDRDRHRARKSKSPLLLRARHREGHRHPHRPRHHHHGQHASLTSASTANQPGKEPRRTVDPAVPARHAGLRHARRKATTRSNQKQELPTTSQTPKAHGIGAAPGQAALRALQITKPGARCRHRRTGRRKSAGHGVYQIGLPPLGPVEHDRGTAAGRDSRGYPGPA